MQRAGALLGEAQVLLTQSLERLMLSDLHARAHVAVAVHEEGERTGQVLAAKRGVVMFRDICTKLIRLSVSTPSLLGITREGKRGLKTDDARRAVPCIFDPSSFQVTTVAFSET